MRGPVYTRRSLGTARARVPAYQGSHGDDPERRYENWELRVARVGRNCHVVRGAKTGPYRSVAFEVALTSHLQIDS